MIKFINDLPSDVWVAFGINGSATSDGDGDYFPELEHLGMSKNLKIGKKASYACIGYPGIKQGEAVEKYSVDGDRIEATKCLREICVNLPNGQRN